MWFLGHFTDLVRAVRYIQLMFREILGQKRAERFVLIYPDFLQNRRNICLAAWPLRPPLPFPLARGPRRSLSPSRLTQHVLRGARGKLTFISPKISQIFPKTLSRRASSCDATISLLNKDTVDGDDLDSDWLRWISLGSDWPRRLLWRLSGIARRKRNNTERGLRAQALPVGVGTRGELACI